MSDSISPQQPLAEMAELACVLGHHHRLILLEHMARGELPVERLVEASGLSVANTSQHLQQLRRGGFVQTRREFLLRYRERDRYREHHDGCSPGSWPQRDTGEETGGGKQR